MKVLVLCDDKWHPASNSRTGLAALGTDEWQFDFIENAREWSAERMAQYPLVLLTKSNQVSSVDHEPWLTPEVETAFLEFVRTGGGLLVVHSGTIGYREMPGLLGLIGGVFVQHPPQCEVTITPQGYHPITANVEPFTIRDEHYFMETDDPEAHYFLTTISEHGTQEGGWMRDEGKGRVCVLTPGHNVEVWLHPEFQTMLNNALHWCSEENPDAFSGTEN
jgi:trehalose utilization protein